MLGEIFCVEAQNQGCYKITLKNKCTCNIEAVWSIFI